MMIKSWVAVSIVAGTVLCAPMSARAQDVPAEYQQVLSTLGKQGDFKDSVLKVNIPRNDVKVTVAGVATPTPFGFGGWVAMTKGDGGHQVLIVLKNVPPEPYTFEAARTRVLQDYRRDAAARLQAGNGDFLRKRANILIAEDMK